MDVDLTLLPIEVGLVIVKAPTGIVYTNALARSIRYVEGYVEAAVSLDEGRGCFCGGMNEESFEALEEAMLDYEYRVDRAANNQEGWVELEEGRVLVYPACEGEA